MEAAYDSLIVSIESHDYQIDAPAAPEFMPDIPEESPGRLTRGLEDTDLYGALPLAEVEADRIKVLGALGRE